VLGVCLAAAFPAVRSAEGGERTGTDAWGASSGEVANSLEEFQQEVLHWKYKGTSFYNQELCSLLSSNRRTNPISAAFFVVVFPSILTYVSGRICAAVPVWDPSKSMFVNVLFFASVFVAVGLVNGYFAYGCEKQVPLLADSLLSVKIELLELFNWKAIYGDVSNRIDWIFLTHTLDKTFLMLFILRSSSLGSVLHKLTLFVAFSVFLYSFSLHWDDWTVVEIMTTRKISNSGKAFFYLFMISSYCMSFAKKDGTWYLIPVFLGLLLYCLPDLFDVFASMLPVVASLLSFCETFFVRELVARLSKKPQPSATSVPSDISKPPGDSTIPTEKKEKEE